jgi:hypothetical protein
MNTPAAHALRDVLADVAAGRISPAEATALLSETVQTEAPTSPPAAPTGDVWADVTDRPVQPSEPAASTTATTASTTASTKASTTASTKASTTAPTTSGPTSTVPANVEPTRVVIRSVGHRLRVIGEPSVATVSVDGPHVVRRDGSTLTVASEGEFGASIDGFTLMRTRSVTDLRDRLLGLGRDLSVRVNPKLSVEIEVTAGSLTAERLPNLEQVRVTAGSAKVHDAADSLDLLVQAGSAKVAWRPTGGRSRLRVESGSLDLRFLPGSNVRVRSDVQAGRVHWQGEHHQGSADEVVLGTGAGTANVEAVMGTVSVRAE